MKIKLSIIKKIIKEELQSVLDEDLYVSDEEKEQAIEDFMKLHNVSREEAKKAIDSAGDEMDQFSTMFKRYTDKDKLNLKDYKFFIKFAKFNEKEILKGTTEEEILNASQDFKINYEEFLKMHRDTKRINSGYEHCLNKRSTMDVREPSGERSYDDTLAALSKEEDELKKSFLTRDLGSGFRANKIKKELDVLQKKKKDQCDYYLGLAALRIKQEHEQYIERNKNRIIIDKLKEEGFIILKGQGFYYFKIKNPKTKRYFAPDIYFRINDKIGVEENIEQILNKLAKKYPYSIEQAKKRKERLTRNKGRNMGQIALNMGYSKEQIKNWTTNQWQGFFDHRDPNFYGP